MNRKNGEEKIKLHRILRIDDEIRSGTYPNSVSLAKKLEVSNRTILRDLDYLRDFHNAPLGYDYTRKGFYYTDLNFFIKNLLLTEDEVKTITIYDNFLQLSDNDLSSKVRKIIGKILAVVPENLTKDLPFSPPGIKDDFFFGPSIVLQAAVISEVNSAIKKKKVIEVKHWKSDSRKYTKHILEPLYVFYKRHGYYLLAFDDEKKSKPGIYSFSRMKEIHLTGACFEIPEGFKISDYLTKGPKEVDVSPADNKLYLFELLFPKEIAEEVIEKVYYYSQTVQLREDGTVFVSFRSTRLHEVFRWVIAEGRKVKVLNPPELVQKVKAEIEQVRKFYI